jgi:nucleoside 2-deoxyribosyltransferase
MAKIYFAGPLFTWGEREQNKRIVAALRSLGHEVFLPQESEQVNSTSHEIFQSDVSGLDWSDTYVGCMDGPDPDSGTCFEAGAIWQRKPMILYQTDIRDETPFGPYNLMLHQAADATLDCKWMEPERIARAIDAAIRAVAP